MLDLEKLMETDQEKLWAISMIGFVYTTGVALMVGLILLTFLF